MLGDAASSPGMEPSPRSRGVWGSLRRTAAMPAPRWHGAPCPCSGTATNESQDAPQGSGPPIPRGHLSLGSSPSSAFPGGFRLPLFLRLPGARTFVPARPRLPAPGVPPPPALTERAGGSAAMKHRGLPRHSRRAAGGREPAPVPPPPPRTPQTSIFSSN